jgi:two-component system, chemotaxis family, protein-glutamate methylesterase/glutaminase
MTVERRGSNVYLALNQDRPENSCRPAVDALFRSATSTFGAKTLAVVLSGMGSDGVLPAQVVRQHGGRVIVLDEHLSRLGHARLGGTSLAPLVRLLYGLPGVR